MTREERRFAVIGAFVLFVLFVFPQWRDYERLTHAGARTVGWVIAKEPDKHNSVRYAYRVGSRQYEGSGTVGFGGVPPLDNLHIGDRIPVSYRPDHPAVSLPGDPSELYHSWSGLLFVFVPLLSLTFGWQSGRRSDRPESGAPAA